MESPSASNPCPKKHKKHKRDKDGDKPSGLKLILKVGSNNTPEHNEEYLQLDEESQQKNMDDPNWLLHKTHHKKSKKKKKKKDREKRHKHHHKDKKRKREEVEDEKPNTEDYNIYPCIGSPGSHREPRTCVVKKMQERTPLSKALDHLLTMLEKKDPQNFFAWPVTDNIAPGYSSIITNPMDFSTMRQKIEENQYNLLQEFVDDFQLMCNNAMKYNHVDTVYYKASKKLLQAGLKAIVPEKLGWVVQLVPELTSDEVGFEITAEMRIARPFSDHEDPDGSSSSRRMPATHFEPIPDDLTPEEILAGAQAAARQARARLIRQRRCGPSMGFLKQKKDGTTHLNILVGGDGVIPGTRKRPVLLGQLVGKLQEGSSQLQGFREDRRNQARPVKPLYYGAFGSYAPSHDSAFANLSKDESDLVLRTYGGEQAAQYAESVQDFVKDSDYASRLVDSLLDLLTGGDHSKTKTTLDSNRRFKEEEEAVRGVLEARPRETPLKVDVDELRSLKDVGIDVKFLDEMEDEIKMSEERHELQQKLNDMCQLLDKLQKTQHERLSQPPPPLLNQLPGPSAEETQLAVNVTGGLTEIARRVPPGAVAPVPSLRKALGVSAPEAPPPEIHIPNGGPSDVPDLESELRQFLESEQSELQDDKTIEEILME